MAADILSRNEYASQKYPLLSTEGITNIGREMYTQERIVVPVDYNTIRIAQANDNKLRRLINSDTTDTCFKVKSHGQVAMTVKLGKDNH